MSHLNLHPNLVLIGWHFVIFVCGYFIVYKYYAHPYLKLKEFRAVKVGESAKKLTALQEEGLRLERSLSEKMQRAKTELLVEIEKIKDDERTKANQVVSRAKETAMGQIEAVKQEVDDFQKKARESLPQLTQVLSNNIAKTFLAN